MKVWKTLKTWLAISCVCFTVITLLMLIDNHQVLRTLLCAPCIGLAFMLFNTKKIARWARILLHYVICVGSVFAILYLPISASVAITRLLMLVLFSLIYWVLFGVVALIASRIRVLREQG